MSKPSDDESAVAHGRVLLRTSTLQGAPRGAVEGPLVAALENLTAAASELLHAGAERDFSTLFASLGSKQRSGSFHELTLISPEWVYLVSRDRALPETALVAVSQHSRKLGLLLSDIRARLSEQEPER